MECISMVDVTSHHLFPTVIHEFNLDIDTLDKKHMVEYIRKGEKKPNGMIQTEDDLHVMSYFKKFKDEIIELNKKILDKLGYEYEDIIITGMWGNVLHPGQVHSPHTHSNNFLSGVFYLQSDDHSAGLEFFDPRAQTGVLCPRIKNGNVMNANAVGFDPRENMGLIFPSWLQHWVKTNDGKERMSVSWNTLTKGHYGGALGKANAYI